MERKITVLLVDDHALVRKSFRRVIEDEPSIDVVGEAGDGAQAVQMACKLKPTVVLMDSSLPGVSGLLATRQIAKSCPHTAVLMCSVHDEDTWVRRAIAAGARGYVFKKAVDLELAAAIKRVAAGELLFEQDARKPSALRTKRRSGLSAREVEVLRLIVNGRSNREIALHLDLSINTVAAHRANIMKSLGFHKTAELVAYAIRKGLATVP
ncbi:MAG TPA: response regulator transcription factor [Terriglobales bacterium]|nr:response regulator transcription factor [Terriglobales bacterium]